SSPRPGQCGPTHRSWRASGPRSTGEAPSIARRLPDTDRPGRPSSQPRKLCRVRPHSTAKRCGQHGILREPSAHGNPQEDKIAAEDTIDALEWLRKHIAQAPDPLREVLNEAVTAMMSAEVDAI